MTTSTRKQQIQTTWAASWGSGDVDALDELLDVNYRRHMASGGTPQNRQQFKDSIRASRQGFPDLTTTIEEILEEGDRLAIRWRSTGTHTGTFQQVPPTGREVEVFGVTFASFSGPTVTDEWVTWDPRQLLTALGIITVGGTS